MDVDPAVLRQRLGLPDDADEQAITQALNQTAAETETETVAASASQVPDGMQLVDTATLDSLRSDAQAGRGAADRLAREDRDRAIAAAIQEGRFPVSRRAHYEQAWDRDPDGTRTLLTASAADGGLAPGLVPVAAREVGQSGDGDSQPAAAEAEHRQLMARFFPNEHARLTGGTNGRTRVRQEA